MNVKRNERYVKSDDNYEDHSGRSISLSKLANNPTSSWTSDKADATKTAVQFSESSYVLQIVTIGVRNNLYEAKMLLSPEADLSSLKVTVKDNNLRVTIDRLIKEEQLINRPPGLTEETLSRNLLRNITKHQENFLIPDVVNSDRIRAVVDNKRRLLFLTAPIVNSRILKRVLQNPVEIIKS